jgi:alpha-D-ribose 1-methylphosphonate 5-triphosphate synthase subunit PhnL
MIHVDNVSKTFTLHNQGGAVIEVMRGASLSWPRRMRGADRGLGGREIHADADDLRQLPGASGSIRVGDTGRRAGEPREILDLRRHTLGYVSQFLRVVPRVPTLRGGGEPLLASAHLPTKPAHGPKELLTRLNIPQALCGALAHHLLGRRTTAREHRPRLCARLPCDAARRAHRLARRHQPRDGAWR